MYELVQQRLEEAVLLRSRLARSLRYRVQRLKGGAMPKVGSATTSVRGIASANFRRSQQQRLHASPMESAGLTVRRGL